MDVDAPNILKRCSSAPLINEATSTVATSPTTSSAPRNTSIFSMFNNNQSRPRRHSGTFGHITSPVNTINSWARMTPRVNQLRVIQLRAEECADVSNTREVAHEREIHTAMQMGQSYEELNVAGLANSPTRTPRFSPAVSPSPTRKYTTRRSLSPIAIRASCFSPVPARPGALAGKRRFDDGDSPLSKRMCTSDRLTPSTPGTPDSDSLECTFRPVSPRAQPMADCAHDAPDTAHNHKSPSPS